MNEWFVALTLIQKVFFFIALPSSVVLVIQIILMFLGIGNDDGGVDHDGDIHDGHDHDDGGYADTGLRFFTVRGLVAFFTVGGWAGFAFGDNMHYAVTLALALVFGAAALVVVAYMFKWSLKLQYDGTLNLSNAVGRTGEVYIILGADGKVGKITVEVQGRLIEMDAVTNGGKDLKAGTAVKVVAMQNESTAIVEPAT